MEATDKQAFAATPLVRLVALLLIILAACSPSTQITGTWKSPEASKTYENIVVAALTNNVLARQEVENDLQTQLQMRGIKASKSIDIFPPSRASKNGPDVNLLIERIRERGNDAILTVALVDQKTESRYIPGTYRYEPMTRYVWYGRFRGYYTYWFPILYEPGYYTEDKIYYLETNLYDVGTENLMWSAQTKSYSPSNLRKAAEKFAEITVTRLGQENLIRPTLQEE